VVIVDICDFKELLAVLVFEDLDQKPVLFVEAKGEEFFELAVQPFEIQAFELPKFFFILYFAKEVHHIEESINNSRGIFFAPLVFFI